MKKVVLTKSGEKKPRTYETQIDWLLKYFGKLLNEKSKTFKIQRPGHS
jgi:hypothetical protein